MKRAKHAKTPITTRKLILQVALELFCEYGIQEVKMQDIVDKLAKSKLTKGAIYHHFDNKDDILYAIFLQYFKPSYDIQLLDSTKTNGRDKLKLLLLRYIKQNKSNASFIRNYLSVFQSKYALSSRINFVYEYFIPIIEVIIEQGNSDGSLNVAYPSFASETLAWSAFIWLDCVLYPLSERDYTYKVRHTKIMLDGVGLGVFDEEINEELAKVWALVYA